MDNLPTPSGDEPPKPSRSDDDVEAQARRWLTALYVEDGGIDRAAFQAWLEAAPEHAQIYRRLEQAWRDLPLSDALDLELAPAPRVSRRKVAGARRAHPSGRRWLGAAALAASAAACVGAAFIWSLQKELSVAPVVYATQAAQLDTVSLPDGSTIAMGADTLISTSFTANERAIVLDRGTAYFDIAHDQQRPLTVRAANTNVRVLGTAFEVWSGPSGVRVSVTRGRVAVAAEGEAEQTASPGVRLGAGEQVSAAPSGALGEVTNFTPDEVLSWRQGRLSYRDAPLIDIVADLNRYRAAPIRIADNKAAGLRITAAFRIDQGEQVLAGLAASQPITIRQDGDALVVSSSP